MQIGGLQKLTLIDYPGKIVATVFLIGCNFRCPYCHNPELVDPKQIKNQVQIKELDFFKFLDKRINLLDGVCITGGEPTVSPDLPRFIKKIKKRGFLVKLDTNGSNPKMLKFLIKNNLIDFIAMDVKTSISKYNKVKAKNKIPQIKESINIIKNSNKDYEFRITVVPRIVDKKDIKEIGKWLEGAKKFVIQQFRPVSSTEGSIKSLDPSFENIKPYSLQTLQKMVKILKPYIDTVELRE